MSQIDFITLNKEWTPITGLSEGETYIIQNRGRDIILALESSTTPSEGETDGVLIAPYEIFYYATGDDGLYLRAYNTNSAVNISTAPASGGGTGPAKKKYGVDIDSLLGETSAEGGLNIPNENQDLVFTGVKYIASQALMWKFLNTGVQSVSFPDLEKIHTPSAMESCFYNSSVATLSVPKLREISGALCCRQAFYRTNIESVEFTALTDLTARYGLQEAFAKGRRIASIRFPVLTNLGSETNQFNNMLQDVTGCTVHFPAALQSTLSSWSDVQNGFGGTNTIVLYDL